MKAGHTAQRLAALRFASCAIRGVWAPRADVLVAAEEQGCRRSPGSPGFTLRRGAAVG